MEFPNVITKCGKSNSRTNKETNVLTGVRTLQNVSEMREDSLNKLLSVVSFEERVIKDYKEIPCKDMDRIVLPLMGKYLLAVTKNVIITPRNWADVFSASGGEDKK